MLTTKEQNFKEQVTSVCLEINSDCNRKCVYCPHSLMERPRVTMQDATLAKILQELAKIAYSGWLCLNIYNEPLLHYPFLLKTMAAIKSALPDARINFSTNGDHLSKEMLEELIAHGLARLTVTCHQNAYSTEKAEKLVRAMLHKLGFSNAEPVIKQNTVVARVSTPVSTSGGGGGAVSPCVFFPAISS